MCFGAKGLNYVSAKKNGIVVEPLLIQKWNLNDTSVLKSGVRKYPSFCNYANFAIKKWLIEPQACCVWLHNLPQEKKLTKLKKALKCDDRGKGK